YEEKFGRVFLIRAAGRSRPEILAELRRRLELDPETEAGIVGAELRDIALLRIPQLFSHLDAHSGYDESEAAR
ncbi:MAG: 2-oxo-4-hydroxy-4-carboxy-5-ureidoimidazoline decarboxylase, partial [Actinomycetes bacterium]